MPLHLQAICPGLIKLHDSICKLLRMVVLQHAEWVYCCKSCIFQDLYLSGSAFVRICVHQDLRPSGFALVRICICQDLHVSGSAFVRMCMGDASIWMPAPLAILLLIAY